MNSLSTALRQLYADRGFCPRTFLDQGDFAFVSVHVMERSIALLAPQLRGELLDVGCGTQPYNAYLGHIAHKTNCDFDASRGQVDFTCSATDIPRPDESFDSILCTEVLEHVSEPIRVWKEFFRVLRPGGQVLLTAPMYWPAHEVPHDYYRYTEHGLRYLAESNGFEVKELFPRGGIYLFLGQSILLGLQQYFPLRLQRILWNRFVLFLDRARCNPRMTLGWTMLAQKPLSGKG